MKYLLTFLLIFSSTQINAQTEFLDPLRGTNIDTLLRDSMAVYSIKIDSAQHGSGEGFCDYLYTATVQNIYKGGGSIGGVISFVTSQSVPIDANMLVVRNNMTIRLNRRFQDRCLDNARRTDNNVQLLRQDELIRIFKVDGQSYLFLPARAFWSDAKPVIEKGFVKIDDMKYIFLLYADGHLPGTYYRLEDILEFKGEPSEQRRIGGT